MDLTSKTTQLALRFLGVEAPAPHLLQNLVVFRPIGHMRYRWMFFFDTNQTGRLVTARTAFIGCSSLIYYCHRRTLCPTNLKLLWLSLRSPFLRVLNKSQKFLRLSQSQQPPSTNTRLAGRGFGFAHTFHPQPDWRTASC